MKGEDKIHYKIVVSMDELLSQYMWIVSKGIGQYCNDKVIC